MTSRILEHLFASANAFNKRYGYTSNLYKFHKLYEERATLSDDEKRTALHVPNENRTGFYLLNPFFLDLLRNHAIWFSPGKHFNDPWDAGTAVSVLRSDRAIEDAALRSMFDEAEYARIAKLSDDEKYAQIQAELEQAFRAVRFACLAQHYDNAPMWAHYADNNRGVCFAFRFMKFSNAAGAYAVDWNFRAGYPVRYEDDFARVGDINDFGSALSVLYTKHPSWSYEREVRFMSLADPGHQDLGVKVSFNKSSLTAVILGCNVPPALWHAVRMILDEYDYEHTKLIRAVFNNTARQFSYLEMVRK